MKYPVALTEEIADPGNLNAMKSKKDKEGNKLSGKLKRLPQRPGIYLFKNARGKVIYVGKAKVLRNRVRQYFQKSHRHDPKTESLVAEIADVDLITTENELEAIILENSLIKTEKPRFNIILRDDKDWLYLRLTVNEPFPRALLLRRPEKGDSLLFGPFIPAYLARKTKAILHKYFGIRTCSRNISGEDPRACLQFDMGRCCAPCVSKDVWDEYGGNVRKARLLLEGKNSELISDLKEAMLEASRKTLYEKAAGYRDALEVVQRQAEDQRVASTGFEEQDIFAYHFAEGKASMVMFSVRAGLVRSKKEFAWENISSDEVKGLLGTAIQQFYHGISYIPKTVVIQKEFDDMLLLREWLSGERGSRVEIVAPQRGKKRHLLQLALENAKLAWKSRFLITEADALSALQDALGLPSVPKRIECFDISSIQGTDQVGSMVSWINGQPRKSEYRKYKIKTVEGSDDFASMQEVVRRRYTRLVREDKNLPDLVLVDGGKGQLGAALAALDSAGAGDLPLAALAKREELLYVPERPEAIRLEPTSPALKLVQRIRDEAHRFAVSYHRDRRAQRALTSILRRIPGIGQKRAKKLLVKFGSLERVRQAEVKEIAKVVGAKTAKVLKAFLEEN